MRIVQDSREQLPYQFSGPRYEGVRVEVGTLATGDYSAKGVESLVAVERKSLADLIGCLTSGRERFTRELERARGLESFIVVVEASWADIASGNYRSAMKPHAACQSILSMTAKYGTPFFFAGNRAAAEYATWGFIRQYIEGARKRLQTIIQAHGEQSTTEQIKKAVQAA